MKYFRYYFQMFKVNLMSQMAERANFWVWIIVHSVSLLTNILFFKIIYSQILEINGWSINQVLLVLGTGTLITGIGSLTFFPFMYEFGKDILSGDFDMKLTKPLDTHFQAAFSWIDVEDIVVAPISILLIIYSLDKLKPPFLPFNIFVYFVLITSSMAILFSILTLVMSLAFKFVKVDSFANFYWSIVNISKYPAKSIKNVSFMGAVFLLPIALISSVPSEVLFGRYELPWIIGSIFSSLFLFIISRKIFQKSLRNYSSASS